MTQSQVIEIVKNNNPEHFQKFGTFSYRIATEEEEVVTEINGEVEVKNTAKVGDYILTGIKGEYYILKPQTFNQRYRLKSVEIGGKYEWQAEAKGECWGNVYHGSSIEFESPWFDKDGNPEKMICENGDYLVSPNAEFSQAYRIEKNAFKETYKKVEK